MITHIRPWEIFRHLGKKSHDIHLTIPAHRGTESLTIMSIETILLVAMARIVEAKSILEVGTSLGYTALHLAMNTDAEIHTIDRDKKTHAFKGTFWESWINFINDDVSLVSPFPCDMVFCDCNYSPELTLKCTELAFACSPKVVAWHDYGNPEAPHQKETLGALAETMDIYHIEDTWVCCWLRGGL